MTEQTQNTEANAGEDEATLQGGEALVDQTQAGDDLQVDELALLKQRARLMGVEFSNNISLPKLKEKIAAKQAGEQTNTQEEAKPLVDPSETSKPSKAKTKTIRQFLIEREMKLVRLRITNLDPKKKDLPGEIFTVANEYLGTVRKFVPFGEVTENGYHVPFCIYQMMKARKFLNIRTRTDRSNGNQIIVEQQWAQEFALEVLDPLTPEEIAKLAAAQTAAGGIS